ncbi:MAG: dihydrofolate reductase family protein [Elusimicrobiota bacterium]|nr:dihydrofolate reductase family protein [Elusimicrobiota bacterium]
MKKTDNRPYIICHMIPSLDGRIVTRDWKLPRAAYGQYDTTAATFKADAWMVGRVSMAPYAGKPPSAPAKAVSAVPAGDFVAEHKSRSFAIVLDPSGKLAFRAGHIDGEHVISVITEKASLSRKAALRAAGVSYLIGGKETISLVLVMRKLRMKFGIKRLLLEGGGKINGTMLKSGLIDELSVLVAPAADGRINRPTLFDAGVESASVTGLKLIANKTLKGDVVWLRYRVV